MADRIAGQPSCSNAALHGVFVGEQLAPASAGTGLCTEPFRHQVNREVRAAQHGVCDTADPARAQHEQVGALLQASGWRVLPISHGTTLASLWPLAGGRLSTPSSAPLGTPS